jgi:hypothetical protein
VLRSKASGFATGLGLMDGAVGIANFLNSDESWRGRGQLAFCRNDLLWVAGKMPGDVHAVPSSRESEKFSICNTGIFAGHAW